MANQRWYQKASVQAAIVTGGFTLTAVVIGLLLKGQTSNDPPKVAAQVTVVPSSPHSSSVPSYDRSYSAESIVARKSLRGALRNLSAAESGLKVQQLAAGTFGFSHDLLFRHSDFEVDRVPNGRLSFELHKIAVDEVYAVAFVNADTQRKVQTANWLTEPATIYSDMWKDAPYAVLIAVASCRGQSRTVTLDDGRNIMAVDCVPATRKRARK